jgi:hypothetical protein
MKYDVYFKEKVIRKFIDESDWHPAIGQDYYRPLDLSVRGFYAKCMNDGYDWHRWDAVRVGLPNLIEMIDGLEDWGYRFHTVDGLTDFTEQPSFELVKSPVPIIRISKNLIRSEMDCHPVLNGMLYDKEVKKRNAIQAISLIKNGCNVREAISQCHSSYPSIREFGYKGTDRQCPRKTIKKVKMCIDKINSGTTLSKGLKELKLGAWSFYRYKSYF